MADLNTLEQLFCREYDEMKKKNITLEESYKSLDKNNSIVINDIISHANVLFLQLKNIVEELKLDNVIIEQIINHLFMIVGKISDNENTRDCRSKLFSTIESFKELIKEDK